MDESLLPEQTGALRHCMSAHLLPGSVALGPHPHSFEEIRLHHRPGLVVVACLDPCVGRIPDQLNLNCSFQSWVQSMPSLSPPNSGCRNHPTPAKAVLAQKHYWGPRYAWSQTGMRTASIVRADGSRPARSVPHPWCGRAERHPQVIHDALPGGLV
jgi:hypothetical protein